MRPRTLPVSYFLSCLMLAAPAAHAQAPAVPPGPAALPVTGVTLYTSGVGYFERGGQVDGEASQTLLFPVGEINDVLKSLVLLDGGGGTIRPVTYGALDPIGKQLQAFSVDVSDNPDLATLLNRMRGAEVTATYSDAAGSKTVTGTIVGTQAQLVTLPNGGGTTQQSFLTLLSGGGLKTVPLAAVTDTQINDPILRGELASALAAVALSRDASKRPLTLSFSGHGRRNVLVGYLTEAPLWQSSYRLVLGKQPVLQGWASVQNTGQDDWNGVHLTLVSGRPISFIQDLYTPLYLPRPVVQASVIGSPTPQTYGGSLDREGSMISTSTVSVGGLNAPTLPTSSDSSVTSPDERREKVLSNNFYQAAGLLNNKAPGDASLSQSILNAGVKSSGAQLGMALFTYRIGSSVSIPRQKSALIPFLASPIQAQAVSIFNPNVQPAHPLLGARIKNTSGLHLMGGPLTVFDEAAGGVGTAYVGDALIQDTEPGQTRLISYAIDLALDANVESGQDKGAVFLVKLYQGNLVIKIHREQARTYTIKNNSATPRLVVVEHPYHDKDWTLLEPKVAAERTADTYRFDLPVAAHESRKLLVREAYPDVTILDLLQTNPDTFLFYLNGSDASPAVKAALKDILARRARVSDLQSKIAVIDAETQAITQGQERIRNNMRELDRNAALYIRYAGELDTQETRLETLKQQKATLQTELAQAQNALNTLVANVDLG